MRRIEAEELSLDVSEIVITSTRQEIEEQWRLYDGFDPILERKLRARIRRNVSCYGRFMPRMAVSTSFFPDWGFIKVPCFSVAITVPEAK
jgi:sucrose-phosphate synthase